MSESLLSSADGRLRIAYFSPLSPIRSGISGYSEELLPELDRYCALDLFVDGYRPTNEAITRQFPVYDVASDARWRDGDYDLAMYHMGNNPYHAYIYRALRQRPGVIVLHDALLHHLVVEETLARQDKSGYVRELGYAHGRAGAALAMRIARGEDEIPHFDYPLLGRVVDLSFGAVVHNQYARSLVEQASPGKRIAVVPLFSSPRAEPRGGDQERARKQLGLDSSQVLIASFGFATPAKRAEVVLRAFSRLLVTIPNARFVWVGEHPQWYDVPDMIESLGLAGAACITGYVDDATFDAYVAAADICISLRYPTAGESSAALLHLMAMGKATIVTDAGWFSELPAGCCLKISVGADEEDSLTAAMQDLANDSRRREVVGARALEEAREKHRLDDAARAYADFLYKTWEDVVRG